MPGTYVRDTDAPNLLSGATLNAAGTTNGTAAAVNAQGTDVTFVISTGTVTGTTPTLTVALTAAEDSAMTTNVVALGSFAVSSGTGAAQSNLERSFTTYMPARKGYVRAAVTVGGTSPVYTGTTLKPNVKHYHRTYASTA